MVVANVRVHGVRDRDMLLTVGAYNRHRDRGIEAAIAMMDPVEWGKSDDGEKMC
jgi:hypothetical protein